MTFEEFCKQAAPFITTALLACWGGAVSHIQKLRTGKKFRWRELLFDLFISCFAGLLTHLACVTANLDGSLAAMLVAMSGHMGVRAIINLETVYTKIFGIEK